MNTGEEYGTHRLNMCYGSVTTMAADIRQVGTLTVYRVFASPTFFSRPDFKSTLIYNIINASQKEFRLHRF